MTQYKKLQITTTFVFIGALFLNLASPVLALTPPLSSTMPPFPTRRQLDIERNDPAVEIIFPADQSFVDRSQPLKVNVHYNAQNIVTTIGDRQRTSYMRRIRAVELLLNGETVEVKRLKFRQREEGEMLFDVSFDSFPKDASQAELQARVYELYVQPSRNFNWNNRPVAESEMVTVLFRQFVGPEGGIIYGPNGTNDVAVIVPKNAFQKSTPIDVFMDTEAWQKSTPSPDEGDLIGVVNLDFGDITTNVPLDIEIPAPGFVTDNDQVLVVEILEEDWAIKFRLIDIAKLENGRLRSQFFILPFSLPLIFKSGLFGFFIPKKNVNQKAQIGYVKGIVYDSDGNPLQGAIVTISQLPMFVSKTDSKGEYHIPSLVGSFAVSAFDSKAGNFKTVGGTVPTKGGGTTVDIFLEDAPLPIHDTLKNGGFEDGLNSWSHEGQVYILSSLGQLSPQEGSSMALITTGSQSVNSTFSTLRQKFIIPQGVQKITLKYDFITREYPDFVGSVFNDVFQANLLTKSGVVSVAFMEVNKEDAQFQPIDVSFPDENIGGNAMGHTNWRIAEANIAQYTGDGTVILSISDVGDTIFDSGVLIDDIRVISNEEQRFLSSPLSGIVPKNLPINSVFDHDTADGIVVAYTGEKGQQKITIDYQCLLNVEKKNGKSKDFIINGNYSAASNSKNELCYDQHDAIDLENKGNVYAAADGMATLNWNTDYYHDIFIRHNNGYATIYKHLGSSPFKNAQGANKGSFQVTRGQWIGVAGGYGPCKGNSKVACFDRFGVHLHFEVRNPQGQKVDPYGWQGSYPDPVGSSLKSIYLWQ